MSAIEPPRGLRGVFRADEVARAVYSEAAGIGRCMPLAVIVAADADDVALAVTWAAAHGFSIVPRGSGSSMGGGAIAPGVVLDLSRLRDVGAVYVDARRVRAAAGVLRGSLDRHAAADGLRFPVDPSSGEFCTIGGMASTNAAGPHSLRHGAIRPWVLSLDCVFADGQRGTVRRGETAPMQVDGIRRFMTEVHPRLLADPRGAAAHSGVLKDSSGYAIGAYAQSQDLVDLLVGSEGSLCVFTAVEVALIPQASAKCSLFGAFHGLDEAVHAATVAREFGAAACELLDRTFLQIAANGGHPLPVAATTEAVLLIELEADDVRAAAASASELRSRFQKIGAAEVIVASEPQREAEMWSFRHAASPALAKMDARLRSMQFIEDAAVPADRLADYVRGVRAILDRAGVAAAIFGHAGDAHVHVNPLIDVHRADWRQTVERILMETTDLVAALRGTLTGEHGDGRLRTPLMGRVWPERDVRLFAEIKRVFDPTNVLNPGVKVPIDGQRAIDVIKYDPTIDALPPAARAALTTIERERAYSRTRLDLL